MLTRPSLAAAAPADAVAAVVKLEQDTVTD